MLDLLGDVLKRARERGATAADAFLVEDRAFSAQVRLGLVDTVKHAREQHLSLRVFSGKSAAAASTSDFSRTSVERLVDEAVSLSRITAPDDLGGLPEAAALAREIPALDLDDPTGHDISPEDKIELARRCEAAALGADPRVTNSEGGDFADRRARYAYATSHGFAAEYATSSFSLSASPVATENGHMQRDGWYHVTRKRANLDTPEEIGLIAAKRAVRRLGARQVKTCEVPVIFDPDMAASLVRHVAGAVAGPSLYRGEGLPVLRTVIVDKGVLVSYLLDSYSGRKLGMASTHHAARAGSGVTVGTTNLYLAKGSTDPKALIASVKQGLYVTELIGFGVNGVTGDYSRGAVGLWIDNGELSYPVEEITIAGNLLEMFQAIEGVGNDLVFRDRTSAPTLLIGRMTVAGA